MAEALKNIYDHALLDSIASQLSRVDRQFRVKHFKTLLLAEPWESRGLKNRIRHVSTCLDACMTGDYATNLATLRLISDEFCGLVHLFIADYVEVFGLAHFDESVQAMQDFTGQSSFEYVRRSVANNLNDISKAHPALVIDLAALWLGRNRDTDRLIKHACRTLLKQGNTPTMRLFGYDDPKTIVTKQFSHTRTVAVGEKLQFSFSIRSLKGNLGKLRMEYAIGFLLGNGKHSNKVFKIAEGAYVEASCDITKAHSFRQITTRRYYPGTHHLSVIVNGVVIDTKEFELVAAQGSP